MINGCTQNKNLKCDRILVSEWLSAAIQKREFYGICETPLGVSEGWYDDLFSFLESWGDLVSF